MQMKAICDYDSAFEETIPTKKRKFNDEQSLSSSKPENSRKQIASPDTAIRQTYKRDFSALSAYDKHILLVNQYLLYHPGATHHLKRDTSKDKRYIDIIRENHQFIWDANNTADEWGQTLAKKYYDKLFKEYCICDLSKYKENKIGMRWRAEKEVVDGKGQFTCGEKRCSEKSGLRSWEMNFSYIEHNIKKNALVKLRVCHDCSYKVNFCKRRKEFKKINKKKIRKVRDLNRDCDKEADTAPEKEPCSASSSEETIWQNPRDVPEEKNREDEFEEYLEDLFV